MGMLAEREILKVTEGGAPAAGGGGKSGANGDAPPRTMSGNERFLAGLVANKKKSGGARTHIYNRDNRRIIQIIQIIQAHGFRHCARYLADCAVAGSPRCLVSPPSGR